jgi:hypothetical protein
VSPFLFLETGALFFSFELFFVPPSYLFLNLDSTLNIILIVIAAVALSVGLIAILVALRRRRALKQKGVESKRSSIVYVRTTSFHGCVIAILCILLLLVLLFSLLSSF